MARPANHVVDLGRGHLEPYRPALPRIMEQMQLQAACASIRLGPAKSLVLERDRRGVEQPNQGLALLAQRAGRDRDQGHRNVAKHCRRPLGIGVGQGRAARRAQIEMVKRPALPAQRGDDLAQASQSRPLREQQTPQMALACPGIIAPAHPVIAVMRGHRAGDDPTIQRFQQAVKCGTTMGHGRPQNHVWQHDFDPKCRVCLPCFRFPCENPGHQCAFAGMTTSSAAT